MTIEWKETGLATMRLTIAMTAIAIIAMALRLAARLKTKGGFAWDDGLILLAFLFFFAVEACIVAGLCTSGGTLDASQMTPSQDTNLSRYLYAIQSFSTLCVTAVKLSILCLYRRVFPLNQFRPHILAVGVLCIVWFFICFFVNIFQCIPAEAAWTYYLVLEGKAKCIVYGHFIIGYESSNILLDIAILALPVRVLRTLKLSMVRKVVVGVIFALGGFVIVICILRTIYMSNAIITSTRALFNGTNWTSVELAVAILCGCIPTYGPLLPTRQAANAMSAWTTRHKISGYKSRSSGYERQDEENTELAVILEETAIPKIAKPFYPV